MSLPDPQPCPPTRKHSPLPSTTFTGTTGKPTVPVGTRTLSTMSYMLNLGDDEPPYPVVSREETVNDEMEPATARVRSAVGMASGQVPGDKVAMPVSVFGGKGRTSTVAFTMP